VINLARVIGIVSGKGGVGKTTVTVNLAIALSKFGKRVIAVDCNLSTPHLAYYLGAYKYTTTFNDALLEKADITSALYHHNSVMFVPASLALEDLITIDVVEIKNHVKKLNNNDMIDFILLDSAPGLGREAVATMDASEEIIYVTAPIYPMVRDVVKCANVAKEFGKINLGVVLNMSGNGRHELSLKDVQSITKIPVIGEIPFDKNIVNGLSVRKPVMKYKPNSVASTQFMRLASLLAGEEYKPSKARLVSQFFEGLKSFVVPERIKVSDLVEEF
jgi:septum site-determining protein MinD